MNKYSKLMLSFAFVAMATINLNAQAPLYPTDLAIDKDANILMTEKGTKRVAIYSADGKSLLKSYVTDAVPTGLAVDGGNLVAAYHAGGERGSVTVAVHQYSVVEIPVADTGINNVFLCYGSWFQRIRYGLPGQFHFVLAGHAQGHVVYR